MASQREIEVKLGVPRQSLRQAEESRVLRQAAGAAKVQRLISVYYDTKDGALNKRGISLRVRFDGRRYVQTVKTAEGMGALDGRGEWETEIAGVRPDLDAAGETPLRSLISKKLGRSLIPVFETRVERKVFPLRYNGTSIEVAVDRGKIISGRRSADISEIEFELKSGSRPERLFDVAASVAEAAPALLEMRSKAERGYALLSGKRNGAEKASAVAIAPDATAADVFRVIGRSCLRQIAVNEPLAVRDDPGGIHEMRVGLRRLRAAISLFKDMLQDAQTDAVRAELKWLTSMLEPPRQLHVFEQRVLPELQAAGVAAAMVETLSDEVTRRRREAAAALNEALDSPRYRRLLIDVAAWIEAGAWSNAAEPRHRRLRAKSITKFAPKALTARTRKVLKRGRHLDRLDAAARHKLRIDAKKLRYAAESFAGLFAGSQARRCRSFIKSLRKLQDHLGDLNDIAGSLQLSEAIANRDAAGAAGSADSGRWRLEYAAGLAGGHEEAQSEALVRAAQMTHRRLAKAQPFWR